MIRDRKNIEADLRWRFFGLLRQRPNIEATERKPLVEDLVTAALIVFDKSGDADEATIAALREELAMLTGVQQNGDWPRYLDARSRMVTAEAEVAALRRRFGLDLDEPVYVHIKGCTNDDGPCLAGCACWCHVCAERDLLVEAARTAPISFNNEADDYGTGWADGAGATVVRVLAAALDSGRAADKPQQPGDVTAALRRLVELKDGPRDAAYEQAKPLAWQAARDALLVDQPQQPDEAKALRFIVGALSDTDGYFLPDESFDGLVGEIFRAMTDAGINPNDYTRPDAIADLILADATARPEPQLCPHKQTGPHDTFTAHLWPPPARPVRCPGPVPTQDGAE